MVIENDVSRNDAPILQEPNAINDKKEIENYSKTTLTTLLKTMLTGHGKYKPSNTCKCTVYTEQVDFFDPPISSIIHRGIYTEKVLTKLEEKGMSMNSIIKTMKFGLLRLNTKELKYFESFKVDSNLLQSETKCSKIFDEELIMKLKAIGLSISMCWNIVISGLALQDECLQYYLVMGGIDVPGILSWKGYTTLVSKEIIESLQKLGVETHFLQQLEESGVDDQSLEVLNDICGYKKEDPEKERLSEDGMSKPISTESTRNDSTTSSESMQIYTGLKDICSSCSGSGLDDSSESTSSVVCQPFKCLCYAKLKEGTLTQAELAELRRNYIKQNLLVPLLWALAKTMKYSPTSPTYYITYQLLRWKYKNVMEKDNDELNNFLNSLKF